MFSPQFYGNGSNPCGCQGNPSFDFYINCGNDRYAIEEIKDSFNRVIELKIFLFNGSTFVQIQHFTAAQFNGAFLSNVHEQDYNGDGKMDLVAEVYDPNCCLLGTVVLVNDCQRPTRPPCGCNDPCPPTRISRSDIAMCKLVEIDIANAPITSVNEIAIKPVSPVTTSQKLCQLMQCCKRTVKCLEQFDPNFLQKIKNKPRTTYSGPVKALEGMVDVNACTITFSGIGVDCSDFCSCGKGINCLKF